MPKHPKREVTFSTDSDGSEVALVPLAGSRGIATLLKADFDFVRSVVRSLNWRLIEPASGRSYVACHNPSTGRPFVIARLIMLADEGARVAYRNGDSMDLRRANLVALARARRRVADVRANA